MRLIDCIIKRAKNKNRTIILPEGTEERIIRAAEICISEGIASIVLIGNKDEIYSKFENIIFVEKIQVIEPKKDERYSFFAQKFYEMRKDKGITSKMSKEIMKNSIYFGAMLLKMNYADGMVAGSITATADVLRPALQIIKTNPETSLVSSFFILDTKDTNFGEKGSFIFADCGLIPDPNESQLADIAISSAKSFEYLLESEPRVAMLSYSTKGSAYGCLLEKVVNATKIAQMKQPQMIIDGELQLDAAIVPDVAEAKCPDSILKGRANVLVFPDLNSGNISYKLVQRLAKADAYGPITQGILKPVNDLSRGCTVDDVVGVIAITALQVQD